ncbi:DUF5683 domain-containing protein [Prevotella sp.]|uniref:DUF5683 domain-containing protein n=1 Tax=Prevotella sp. TaxID=59823 RepID=UPI0039C3A9D8
MLPSNINRIAVAATIAIIGFATSAKAQVETDSTFIFDYEPRSIIGDTVTATDDDIMDFRDAEAEERPAIATERRSREKTGKSAKAAGTWRPDPKRALWLSLVLPGAGQIYNRKYWKLPIVYGGFLGCIYAMQWNNMMYNDYSQAYLDLMDNDPQTQSYNQFLHLGATIDESNKTRYENLFKRRKDYYRRYRDMSFFILVGVYALSVIDAYVDASLSEFDISPDLSMRIEPAVINSGIYNNPLRATAVGVNCSLTF